jgi:hypothetical protein
MPAYFYLVLAIFLSRQAHSLQPPLKHNQQAHLHHHKSNHSNVFTNASHLKVTEFADLKFDRGFYSRHSNECKIAQDHFDLSVKLYLAPSVLKATAVEKFKYFRTVLNAKGEKVTRLRSYSILFQIKSIFKYENHFDYVNRNETTDNSNQTIVFLSSQDEYSNVINLNSFLLVENFELAQANSDVSDSRDCHSSIEIQLNKNYVLFLNAQSRELPLDKRRHFTHPIRLDSVRSNAKLGYMEPLSSLVSYKSQSVVKIMTKMAIFIKVPILNLFSAPILLENSNYDKVEEEIISQACQECGKY